MFILGVFSLARTRWADKLHDVTNALFSVVIDDYISINDEILAKQDSALLEDLSVANFVIK